jgi:hypothetical protein
MTVFMLTVSMEFEKRFRKAGAGSQERRLSSDGMLALTGFMSTISIGSEKRFMKGLGPGNWPDQMLIN